ncbi:MAG: discoidin domain-containing protein [Bacteroidaceae bacterium]
MKKNYILLVLMLIMSATWYGAEASWQKGLVKTTFADGDKIVLANDNAPSTFWKVDHYLNLEGMKQVEGPSGILPDECVIVLEAAGKNGTVDGKPMFYLKQVATGLYYGGAGTTGQKADAVAFEILVNNKKVAPFKSKDNADEATGTCDSITRCAQADTKTIVFATVLASGDNADAVTWLSVYQPDMVTGVYRDTNAWHAYNVTQDVDPLVELGLLIDSYKNLSFTTSPTKAPGYFPEELVTGYTTALEAANNILNVDGAGFTPEAINAAKAALKAAKEAVEKSGYPMKAGYFRFRSAIPSFLEKQGVEKAMYVDVKNNLVLSWDTLNVKNAYFIFKVEPAADGKNWSVQNLGTDTYISTAPASSAIATTEEQVTDQIFTAIGSGQWNIANVTNKTAYHTLGHSSGAGKKGTVVPYNGTINSGSAWYADEITDLVLIDSLNNAMVQIKIQMKLNLQMKTLLAKAKKSYDKGWVFKNLIKESTQLSTNALQTDEGSLENLLDGKTNTYFHSRWGGEAVNEYHYLQVALKEPVSSFRMYTYMRENEHNRPDSMVISASKDGETWTEICSLPNENDTLPYTKGTPSFDSNPINLNDSYSHIRFTVILTSWGNQKHQGKKDGDYCFNGYPFFTYSEFQLYPGDGKFDPTSQNGLYPEAKVLKSAIEEADTLKVPTAEQIATLQAALDAYTAVFVDTEPFTTEIAAAQKLSEMATPGEEMGQSPQTDIDALVAAVAAAKAVVFYTPETGYIKTADLKAAHATLIAAKKAFLASVKSVTPKQWYYIQSRMAQLNEDGTVREDTRYDNGIYAVKDALKWGGVVNQVFSAFTETAYMWRFLAMTDSTFAIQNLATGQYMDAIAKTVTQVKLSATPVPFFVNFIGSSQFALVPNVKDALPLHAQVANSAIVGWQDGANSASAWTFAPIVDAPEVVARSMESNTITTMTLPFAYPVSAVFGYDGENNALEDHTLYSIVGKEGPDGAATAIKLHAYVAGDIIPAGTPVIVTTGDYENAYNAEAAMGTYMIDLSGYADLSSLAPSTYLDVVSAPLSANGLVGTFQSVAVSHHGVGLLELGKLRVVNEDKGEATGCLSGYIEESQIKTIEGLSVDKILPIGEGDPLNIGGITNDNGSKKNTIVTLKGLPAGSSVKDLKPGIYIINGKAVRF